MAREAVRGAGSPHPALQTEQAGMQTDRQTDRQTGRDGNNRPGRHGVNEQILLGRNNILRTKEGRKIGPGGRDEEQPKVEEEEIEERKEGRE